MEESKKRNFLGSVDTSGGKGGDSFSTGRGGDGGMGGSVHFVKVGKEFTEEGITFDDIKDPHKSYWIFVHKKIQRWFITNKKIALLGFLFLILSILTYFGYLKFTPEFNSFIGKFSLPTDTTQSEKNVIIDTSKTLDRSIFNLAWETVGTGLTSQQRVNLIYNISDLKTKREMGNIDDIGTDGLTVLIRGTSSEGSPGIVRCDFSPNWKQRLSLLKKGDFVNFTGNISRYELYQQWIVLKDCELLELVRN